MFFFSLVDKSLAAVHYILSGFMLSLAGQIPDGEEQDKLRKNDIILHKIHPEIRGDNLDSDHLDLVVEAFLEEELNYRRNIGQSLVNEGTAFGRRGILAMPYLKNDLKYYRQAIVDRSGKTFREWTRYELVPETSFRYNKNSEAE